VPRVKINYLGVLSPMVSRNGEYVEVEEPATLGDLIKMLGLRYGEKFHCSLQHADGSVIWGDVAIVIDGVRVDDVDFPLRGSQEIEIALIPMIEGG
jgi:sulfur carrier protein ThiS